MCLKCSIFTCLYFTTYLDCLYFTIVSRVITHSNASDKIVDLAHPDPLTLAKNYPMYPIATFLWCFL